MTENFLKMSHEMQLANLGSEFSRAMKWQGKNEKYFWSEVDRFFEYIDAMITQPNLPEDRSLELTQLREVCKDKFLNTNIYAVKVESIQSYFDEFALIARK